MSKEMKSFRLHAITCRHLAQMSADTGLSQADILDRLIVAAYMDLQRDDRCPVGLSEALRWLALRETSTDA